MDIKKLVEVCFENGFNHPLYKLAAKIGSPEKTHYYYIATPQWNIVAVVKDLELRGVNFSTSTFLDAGCGIPVIPNIFSVLGCDAKGLEFNPMYCRVFPTLINGDILNYSFKKWDIIYSYNPLTDAELMVKGIKQIMRTMRKGAIFYFTDASGSINEFRGKFTQLEGTNTYVYQKP